MDEVAVEAPAPAPFPTEAFTWRADATAPVLDASGTRIAWVAGWTAGSNICTAPVEDPTTCTVVGTTTSRSALQWAGDGSLLVIGEHDWSTIGDTGGHGVLADGEVIRATPDGRLLWLRPHGGRWAITSLAIDGTDSRDEGWAKRGVAWLMHPGEQLPAGYVEAVGEPGARKVFRAASAGRAKVVARTWGSTGTTWAPRWKLASSLLLDGKALVIDGAHSDHDALVTVDLQTGEREVRFEPSQGTVADVLQDPDGGRVLAVSVRFERTRWQALDDAVADDISWLNANVVGDYDILRATDQVWQLYTWTGTSREWWLYDRERHALARTAPRWPGHEELPWGPVEALAVRTGDGFEIPAYLTRPNPDRWGSGPHPLLVWVHGGPWSEGHGYGFDPMAQLFAGRGWAYLAVDMRGSAGYGEAFRDASAGELWRAMQQDVNDAVVKVIDLGGVDPARVAWFGGSYGGGSVLRAAVEAGAPISCGVSWDGPPRWGWLGMGLRHDWTLAPARRADDVHVPLLLLQGRGDGKVSTRGVRRFADRAVAAGAAVTLVEFPGERHQFTAEATEAASAMAAAFLAECAGLGFEVPDGVLEDVPRVLRHDAAGTPWVEP